MQVIKRNGEKQNVSFDKITQRIHTQCKGLHQSVDASIIAKEVVSQIYNNITTVELDQHTARIAAEKCTTHPDYSKLAARIETTNLYKKTPNTFSECVEVLFKQGIVSKKLFDDVSEHQSLINNTIDHTQDDRYDYFGFKTLEKAYLLRDVDGNIVERPQYMLMRVAVGIWGDNLSMVTKTYQSLSQHLYTHATPTLFNAGTNRPQLSSCFLTTVGEDTLKSIYNNISDCSAISKWAGGIGVSISQIRSRGSYIASTGGKSNGIVPMLKVYNETARYVDQCFSGTTKVYTRDEVKQIKHIIPNDLVLTHDGTWQKVIRVKNDNYSGQMRKISIRHNYRDVLVTPKHQMLVIEKAKPCSFSNIQRMIRTGYLKPKYIEARYLNSDHFVIFPKTNYVNCLANYSADDFKMYGILIADGWITSNGKQAGVCLNAESKKHILHFVKEYLSEKMIHFTESKSKTDKSIRLVWSVSNLFKFTRSQLYDDNGEKIIAKQFVNASSHKLLNLIYGIVSCDGYVGKKIGTEITLELTATQVIDTLKLIMLRFGVILCGSERNRVGQVSQGPNGPITTKKPTTILKFPRIPLITDLFENCESSTKTHFLQTDNYTLGRVVRNECVEVENQLVYDLEVEANHNYVSEVGLCHNGGGKRKGSFAVYLEPWHADVFDFLDLKKNHGKEEVRARDLFYALWIPDLFMRSVENDNEWFLMDPNKLRENSINLQDTYGDEFDRQYNLAVEKGLYVKKINARELWNKILEAQIETGSPYMLYKDAANFKSNQKNLGTIRSSNLCTEIIQYTSKEETAVCNLASIALPRFVQHDTFDFQQLYETTRHIVRTIDQVIDINFYPLETTRTSNLKHRPMGIGVQGLADVFHQLKLPFTSQKAQQLNHQIFECIYHAALFESCWLAKSKGVYDSYKGSPISLGVLQQDLWDNVEVKIINGQIEKTKLHAPRYKYTHNWALLREIIEKYGVRNSLLIAPMPTASTSQILGNNECFEPYTSNIYVRRTLSGEFVVINKFLVNDLIKENLWSESFKDALILNRGSVNKIEDSLNEQQKFFVQNHLDLLSDAIKEQYKTVWELKTSHLLQMSADRGRFIDQSQSLNIWMENPSFKKLHTTHMYAWKLGLKTGMYYLRSKAAAKPISTLGVDIEKHIVACSLDNPDDCLMCGS